MVSRWLIEHRERHRAKLPPDPGHVAAFAADDDERSAGSQGPPQPRQAAVPADVEDQVVGCWPSAKSARV